MAINNNPFANTAQQSILNSTFGSYDNTVDGLMRVLREMHADMHDLRKQMQQVREQTEFLGRFVNFVYAVDPRMFDAYRAAESMRKLSEEIKK